MSITQARTHENGGVVMRRLITFFRRLFRGRKKYTLQISLTPVLPGKDAQKIRPVLHVTDRIAKSSAEAKRSVRKREKGRKEGPFDRSDPVIKVIKEEEMPPQ